MWAVTVVRNICSLSWWGKSWAAPGLLAHCYMYNIHVQSLMPPWIIEQRNRLETCMGAVKLKRMECGISLWSNPSWRKPEAFSMACQHSAGCNPFSLRLWWESFKRRTQLHSLDHRKLVESFLLCTKICTYFSLSYRHHRTCRPPSRLGQLFRGEQRQFRG